jgi:hypothetical protein
MYAPPPARLRLMAFGVGMAVGAAFWGDSAVGATATSTTSTATTWPQHQRELGEQPDLEPQRQQEQLTLATRRTARA